MAVLEVPAPVRNPGRRAFAESVHVARAWTDGEIERSNHVAVGTVLLVSGTFFLVPPAVAVLVLAGLLR